MSIESNIAELTAAVQALTKAIVASTGAVQQPATTKPAEKPVTEKKADKPVATETKAADTPATATAQADAQTSKDKPSDDTPASIDFATQIQAPIVKLAATGKREQALAILAEFGAKRASDIKPEDYARAVALIGKAA